MQCISSCSEWLLQAKVGSWRTQFDKALENPLQWIAAHPDHDSIYVNDPACRAFGRKTLRGLCNLMLENLPAGAQGRTCCHSLHFAAGAHMGHIAQFAVLSLSISVLYLLYTPEFYFVALYAEYPQLSAKGLSHHIVSYGVACNQQ